MSLRPSSGSPASCSGLMYSGVPTTSPVRVTFCASTFAAFAMPKSTTFTQSRPVAVPGDHDVVGLEVAMHDPHVVRHRQRLARLPRDLAARARGQRALRAQDVGERLALDELHREVDQPLGRLAEVVDPGDVRVVDPARVRRLAVEPADGVGVAAPCRGSSPSPRSCAPSSRARPGTPGPCRLRRAS